MAEFRLSDDLPTLEPWCARRLLRHISFKREKREQNSLLIERDDSVAWLQRYLGDVAWHKEEGRDVFYLNETWVTVGHTVSTYCAHLQPYRTTPSHDAFARGLTTSLKQPSGKGQCLIVTYIGSEDDFVEGSLNDFRGKKTGDYHDGTRFEKWFDTALERLSKGSVVVVDNAPYYFRRDDAVLTTASWEEPIQEWLASKGIW